MKKQLFAVTILIGCCLFFSILNSCSKSASTSGTGGTGTGGSGTGGSGTGGGTTTCTAQGWASQNGGTTGGGSGTVTVATTFAELKAAVESNSVKVVRIDGSITIPSGGRINMQDQSNKTIFGSNGATLSTTDQSQSASGIFYLKRCSNIIIRNIIFNGAGAYDVDGNDNCTLETCTNIWIDRCEFRDGLDGNLDIKTGSNFITVSWCKFTYLKPPTPGGPGGSNDHRFSSLIGSSDATLTDRGTLNITFARCWWAQGCVARMPRVRFGKVHVLNSYFSSTVSSSCIQAGLEANLLVEGNVFEGVKNPIDLMANNSTAVQLTNNILTSTTGTSAGNGVTAFTPPYSYTAIDASTVKASVTNTSTGAGATAGGNNCSSF